MSALARGLLAQPPAPTRPHAPRAARTHPPARAPGYLKND